MEVNVKVTVDLGDRTMSLLSGALAANQSVKVSEELCEPKEPEPCELKEPEPEPEPEPEKPAATRSRRTKEQIAAEAAAKAAPAKEPVKVEAPEPEEDAATDFATLSDEDKISALRTKVSTYTKKGKSADIRFMLAQFDARTVSQDEPLKPEDYDAFNEALERYGAGESVTNIFPELN